MQTRWSWLVPAWTVIFYLGAVQAHAEPHAPSPTAVEVAERYGLSGWDQIETIEFTFNVERPDGKSVKRGWRWNVAANTVTTKLYLPGEVQTAELIDLNLPIPADQEKIHQQFINDTYWLLFPFQLVWSNPTVTEAGDLVAFPIQNTGAHQMGRKVVTQWPAEGGYTPGDAYDLYLDDDGLIRQWVFRRGGGEKGRAMTWEDHQHLGPILVSLDHRNADGTFRLWFTDVKATLTDGTAVTPVPGLNLLESP